MLEANIESRRPFRILSVKEGIPGTNSLTDFYDYIKGGLIIVQWL